MKSSNFNAEDVYLFEELLERDIRMIMEAARNYAQTKLEPRALKGNQEEYFDIEIAREMGELGLLGVTLPEEFGGAGADYMAYGCIQRELDRVDFGCGTFHEAQSTLVMYPIFEFGTDEQKHRFLPRLASGELIGCFGLTEPDHGSVTVNFGGDPGKANFIPITDGWNYVVRMNRPRPSIVDRSWTFPSLK